MDLSRAGGSDRLRIAHVTNYQVPGYGYEEIRLAAAQRRLGHDVAIVTSNFLHPVGLYAVLRRRFSERQVAPREEIVDGVRVMRLRAHEVGHRVWIQGFEESIKQLDPDVIHIHNVLQFHAVRTALLRLRNMCRAAIVVDDHMHFSVMRRSITGRIFYLAYRLLAQPVLARYVERYCATTQQTVEYLRTACGVRGPIQVMPLGVTTDLFAPDPQARSRVRHELGFNEHDLVLIYTGKVIPEKGVHLLVEAAARLHQPARNVHVLVVGDADLGYANDLMALAASRQVCLLLRPSVEHELLPPYYAAADIAIWPCQETMAVYEGLAAGLPVVVSASSGDAAELRRGGAYFYEPRNSEALAACLRPLLDPALRQSVGSTARDFAVSTLDWSACARRYLSVYREAVAARTSR